LLAESLNTHPLFVIASDLRRWLELHTGHEPDGRSVKRLIRKGRKKRKGERQQHSGVDVGSTARRCPGFRPAGPLPGLRRHIATCRWN